MSNSERETTGDEMSRPLSPNVSGKSGGPSGFVKLSPSNSGSDTRANYSHFPGRSFPGGQRLLKLGRGGDALSLLCWRPEPHFFGVRAPLEGGGLCKDVSP